jgi:nicotinate-nucleotide adenylyltransferase
MKIGLYFGSFNPIHIGHLIIANHVLNESGMDEIWFVVSPHNPFKESSSLLNENHRLHLVRLAIEHQPKFRASSIEFQLPRPSYTSDTMIHLTEKYPTHQFSIIVGGDSFQNIKKWKNADVLLKNYDLLVYERPGFPIDSSLSDRFQILKAPLLEISSTMIRELIKEKKSIQYLVPDEVRQDILANGYYRK